MNRYFMFDSAPIQRIRTLCEYREREIVQIVVTGAGIAICAAVIAFVCGVFS